MPFSFKPTQGTEGYQGSSPDQPFSVSSMASPTESLSQTQDTYRFSQENNGVSFLRLVLSTVFGVSVLTVIVLFSYIYYISAKIETKKTTLDDFQKKLGVIPLEDMRKVSNRIKVITKLVKEHPSVNSSFRIIESTVENPVTYKLFDLHFSDNLGTYELQLNAYAPSYRDIVEQLDTLKRKPYSDYISNIVVSEIHPDENGNINFSLKMPIAISGVIPDSLMLDEKLPSQNTNVDVNFNSTTTATSTQNISTQSNVISSSSSNATSSGSTVNQNKGAATSSLNKKP